MTQDREEWIGAYEEHEDFSFYRVKGVDVDVCTGQPKLDTFS